MNGVLKILRPHGIKQQTIGRCIHNSRYNQRPDNRPPHHENGKFVQVNGRVIKIPSPPTTCCMSGCANCVYIVYAEEVTNIFRDGGHLAQEIILSNVEDPNMKCFLAMELRNAENKRKK